jgi:hypothetical protein
MMLFDMLDSNVQMLYKQEDKFFASRSLNSLFSHIVLSSATSKCDKVIPNIHWIRSSLTTFM